MKKTLVVLLLTFSSVAVQANEDGDGFTFRCRFSTELREAGICTVQGAICSKIEGENHECENRMNISCDNQIVYQDVVAPKFETDSISMESMTGRMFSLTPALVMRKPESLPELSSAVLMLNDMRGHGFCELKKEMF